jgi:hypothetical protein
MKKLFYVVSLFAGLTNSPLLHAQQVFDGINTQLGLGVATSQVSASGTDDDSWYGSSPLNVNGNTSGTRLVGLASIGYSKSFSSYNLAANLFYVIGNQSAGGSSTTGVTSNITPDGPSKKVSENLNSSYTLKNTWGISLEPGYYFDKDLLAYLKLAYVTTSLQSNLSCNSSDGYCPNQMSSSSQSLNGFGYGLGVKKMFTDSIYGAVDLLGVTYGNVNKSYNLSTYSTAPNNASFKTTQYMGFVSVGYKF